MIPVPENAIEVTQGLVVFVDGKYVCLRKTYTGDDGQRALGRGMNLSWEQFSAFLAVGDELEKEVTG